MRGRAGAIPVPGAFHLQRDLPGAAGRQASVVHTHSPGVIPYTIR